MSRSRPLVLTLTALAFAALPAAAGAQIPSPTGPSGPTGFVPKPKPTPKPQQVKASLHVAALGTHALRGDRVVLAGETFRIRGVVSRYVARQTAVVTVTRDGKKVKGARAHIRKVRGSRKGEFFVTYRPGTDGRVSISAAHSNTAALARARSKAISVRVLSPHAESGDSGENVRFLQQQLFRLNFAVPVDGHFRGSTERAVLAYRKTNGMTRRRYATPRIFFRLADLRGGYTARYPGQGRHVEADLGRQVLVLINPGGRVYKIFHMASGKPSTPTILGTFRFYRQQPGRNDHGMVNSNYFIRGYAIHGYDFVPTHAASHGCIRVPIPSSRFIMNWIHVGDRITVFRA